MIGLSETLSEYTLASEGNPYHDENGRFTSQGGDRGGGGGGGAKEKGSGRSAGARALGIQMRAAKKGSKDTLSNAVVKAIGKGTQGAAWGGLLGTLSGGSAKAATAGAGLHGVGAALHTVGASQGAARTLSRALNRFSGGAIKMGPKMVGKILRGMGTASHLGGIATRMGPLLGLLGGSGAPGFIPKGPGGPIPGRDRVEQIIDKSNAPDRPAAAGPRSMGGGIAGFLRRRKTAQEQKPSGRPGGYGARRLDIDSPRPANEAMKAFRANPRLGHSGNSHLLAEPDADITEDSLNEIPDPIWAAVLSALKDYSEHEDDDRLRRDLAAIMPKQTEAQDGDESKLSEPTIGEVLGQQARRRLLAAITT